MNISEKTGQEPSLTEGNHALELFTDRHELAKLFAGYLNDEPSREKILFFYGDGGNGKSLLLKFLRQNYCKHLRNDSWQQLKVKPDAEVANYIENLADSCEFTPVPAIFHDFEQKPLNDEQPQDPFYGLLMLRRNLVEAAKVLGYHLRFPFSNFACIWYLHKKGKLTQERIKEIFPSEELDLINEIVGLLTEAPGLGLAKAVLGLFNKHLSKEFTLFQLKRGLDEEEVKRIQTLEPDSELIDELPRLLAADLNAMLKQPKAPPRIVLFFDTHEAFWGDGRNCSATLFFQRDEWLRGLLANLELSAGIVVVVAGREVPRWVEASRWKIPKQYVDTQLVWHLNEVNAQVYLQRVGIKDAQLRESLITYASVEADQVHPLFIGLCTDVVLAAEKRGETLTSADFQNVPQVTQKSKVLIEQLLKYADEEVKDAVYALSTCRAFNRDIYLKLGQALNFNATNASFRSLTRFSFVWQSDSDRDWYRIHSLVRRLSIEDSQEITKCAHAVLEQHYRDKGDLTEAIYHAICQNWQRGVKEWLKVFNTAKQQRNFEQCRILLEIRKELTFYLVKSHKP